MRAPRDAAWTADGNVADAWAPFSPVTGELDAFEWRVPVENLDEEQDLQLEEIPSGPMDLPVLEAASGVAIMDIANDDDVVEIDADAVEAEVEAADEDTAEEPQEVDASVDEEPAEADTEEVTGDDADAKTLDASSSADAEESADADEKGQTKKDDPINKPPIDDPGLKAEAGKEKKRFRLF